MDLMSTAQLLGNFGEFLGAVAVVLTLVYLTVQVRQNTQAIRFQSGRESASLVADLATFLIQHDVVESQIRSLGSDPEKVTDVDMFILENILFSWLTAIQQDYLEFRSGLHTDDWWQSKKRVIGSWLSSEAPRSWWKTVGREYFTTDFAAIVDEIIDGEGGYSYIEKLGQARSDTLSNSS